jgi:hypothetical protein
LPDETARQRASAFIRHSALRLRHSFADFVSVATRVILSKQIFQKNVDTVPSHPRLLLPFAGSPQRGKLHFIHEKQIHFTIRTCPP